MTITIPIPDSVAERLQAHGGELAQRTLEALAADGYREGVLTLADVQEMLQLPTRLAVDEALKRHHAFLDYDENDLQADLQAISQAVHR